MMPILSSRNAKIKVRRRGLKVAIVGIPKTIDNDISVIDRSFGFDTAVEEAQHAINVAHVEAESTENSVGVVKLMGHYCGFVAMYATLANRDVDLCLIPESPFYLEGEGGLFEYVEKRTKEDRHMVIVIAEGSVSIGNEQDASGNKLLADNGLWICKKIKETSVIFCSVLLDISICLLFVYLLEKYLISCLWLHISCFFHD